jgi:hypothetical protein
MNKEKTNPLRLKLGKTEGKNQLERQSRWLDNIQMDIGKIGRESVD